MNDLLKLTPDKLPTQYRSLARVIGLEATIRLCNEFGGEVLYIPQPKRLLAAKQRMTICTEFNGYNAKELAKKYGVTERWVHKLVSASNKP